MNLKNCLIILSLSFWPISLYLSNTLKDYLVYVIPSLLLVLSFYLYKKQSKFWMAPILLVPVISPKLAIFPVIFFLILFFLNLKSKDRNTTGIHLLVSLMLLSLFWKPFVGQTITIPDYEAQQKVIRDQHLYPSIFLARTFSNKARIITDKFTANFLALTDPNNYFFSFHPREEPGNQDLPKFPFAALPVFIYGMFRLTEDKYRSFILILSVSLLASLALLTNFDRNDFILWLPLSYLLALGFMPVFNKRSKIYFLTYVYSIFLIPDLIALLLRFTQ